MVWWRQLFAGRKLSTRKPETREDISDARNDVHQVRRDKNGSAGVEVGCKAACRRKQEEEAGHDSSKSAPCLRPAIWIHGRESAEQSAEKRFVTSKSSGVTPQFDLTEFLKPFPLCCAYLRSIYIRDFLHLSGSLFATPIEGCELGMWRRQKAINSLHV